MNEIEAYIRQAAQARGIDPEIAVRVAKSEGGLNDPFRQGEAMLKYGREESYGPFQLHMRQGGVGTRALAAGIDPRTNWKGGVDYGLNEAAKKGWGQWFGAAKAGVGNYDGIRGARPAEVTPALSPEAMQFVQNNPQPGGFGLGVPDPNSPDQNSPPVFGSMSAGIGQNPQGNGIDPAVANFAFGAEGPSMGDRLSGAGKAFDSAMSEVKAPSIAKMPSPSGDVANGLMKLMQNPQALAQLLMKQRMG